VPRAAIRKDGHHLSMAERDLDVVAAVVPIYGLDGKITGALSLSGPAGATTRADLEKNPASAEIRWHSDQSATLVRLITRPGV
jgi:DNA-binding IclR family transcriptional regulator